jgi:hypothetical protein
VSEDEKPLSIRARRRFKAEFEKLEREKQIGLFQKRMDLAKSGAKFFKEANYREAVQSYYSYLDILEKAKQVKAGALDLKHFDQKKDIAELLLLTGVYWDLAKLHDKVSKKDTSKVDLYLDRFVLFSKGLPYQHLSAELVRKYLVNGTPKNRKNFKDAHIRLGGGKCFIATAVEEHCAETTLSELRKFRDEKLLPHRSGRGFVRVYYAIGPWLARAVLRAPEVFQKVLAFFFDQIAKKLAKSA